MKWARIESRGGCAVSGDDVEAPIDAFVAALIGAAPATTTTTTATTTPETCPPTTALYRGPSGCGLGALCPAGMTCDESTRACSDRPSRAAASRKSMPLGQVPCGHDVRHGPDLDGVPAGVRLPPTAQPDQISRLPYLSVQPTLA